LAISAGQTATFTVTATALNGFNSPITNFACSGEPGGTTCVFSKSTLNPVGGTTDSLTVTLQTNSNPYQPAVHMGNMGMGMMLPLFTMGIFGMVVAKSRRRRQIAGRYWWRWLGFALGAMLFSVALLSSYGCGGGYGGSSSATSGTQRGTTTMMITAQSGSITHSASVSLTVQ
jgi:hypothetical protein